MLRAGVGSRGATDAEGGGGGRVTERAAAAVTSACSWVATSAAARARRTERRSLPEPSAVSAARRSKRRASWRCPIPHSAFAVSKAVATSSGSSASGEGMGTPSSATSTHHTHHRGFPQRREETPVRRSAGSEGAALENSKVRRGIRAAGEPSGFRRLPSMPCSP